jgi:molecular chaperone DnaK
VNNNFGDNMVNDKVLGIDLGTSNSVVAVLSSGKPKIIPPAEGLNLYGNVFPSYVAFEENGNIIVGEPARRQLVSNPKNTIYNIKRKMGTDYKIKIQNKEYTPQEISARILQKIKKDAEDFLDDKIKKAVITVPAYFNDDQRTATKDAGAIAGLDVIRLVNEPTAASLAYGFDRNPNEDIKIMVYDFGGGTIDITILNFENGVFDVKSTSGDTELGGTDIDEIIIDYAIEEFKKENNINLKMDEQAIKRLKVQAELAKIELSDVLETEINIPFIALVDGNPVNLIVKLTRTKLEELIKPIIKKSEIPLKQALEDAKFIPSDIDKLILVGGTTRIPFVRNSVEQYVGKVAEKGIDPMECVAKGAAIEGGILENEVEDIVLFDVTPLSLGIEVIGDRMDTLIDKNTTIPVTKTKPFTTVSDYQEAIIINVLQGESPVASNNHSLGGLTLEGIKLAPMGVPQIHVTFDIDANGIVSVISQDQDTGVRKGIIIESANKLSNEEIAVAAKKFE